MFIVCMIDLKFLVASDLLVMVTLSMINLCTVSSWMSLAFVSNVKKSVCISQLCKDVVIVVQTIV